jgi:hypothetical protein
MEEPQESGKGREAEEVMAEVEWTTRGECRRKRGRVRAGWA